MHRELILKENGVVVAKYNSDCYNYEQTLDRDMSAFIKKIEDKKQGNYWNWKEELREQFIEAFPYIPKELRHKVLEMGKIV